MCSFILQKEKKIRNGEDGPNFTGQANQLLPQLFLYRLLVLQLAIPFPNTQLIKVCVIAEFLNWPVSKHLMHSSTTSRIVSAGPQGMAEQRCLVPLRLKYFNCTQESFVLPTLRACSGQELTLCFTFKLFWKQVMAPASKIKCHIRSRYFH